jgi:5-formyltetrahydrofolate cyclo-ligase
MDTGWKAERRALRARLIAERESIDSRIFERNSAAITATVSSLVAARSPRLLGFYWPHRRECDLISIAGSAVAEGRQAALPMVIGPGKPLEFRRWWPGIAMATGVYDIPFPASGEPVVPDLIVLPMVGFDSAGYRLGYGGGYYDRTLAAFRPRPFTIGVGFELGRVDTIEPQPHDVPLDMIVTEAGVFP